MAQNEGESMTYFLKRLRGQANFCEFNIKCPEEQTCGQQVDYSEDMVTGQMIAGLANLEHQSRILAEAASLISFEQKFNHLVYLKTTDKSTPHFQDAMYPLASSGFLAHACTSRTRNDPPRRPIPSRLHNISNPAADVERLLSQWGQ